ncbi:hypothetical protein [Dryocola sp. BD613]|uniref:hypothetical protein n=1 Tax=Dryocola sp. BD613 TaxID=3133272 RepID=UPI003F501009
MKPFLLRQLIRHNGSLQKTGATSDDAEAAGKISVYKNVKKSLLHKVCEVYHSCLFNRQMRGPFFAHFPAPGMARKRAEVRVASGGVTFQPCRC